MTEAIVRIDKGIKRGPRSKSQPPAVEQSPKSIDHMGRLKDANPSEILQRYLSDETTKEIAADYGVTRQALSLFLIKEAEEDWRTAQVARALARKEKAEDNMATAADALALARAREELKAAQWDLERVCRRIYGDKMQVEHVGLPILNINIGSGDPLPVVVEQAKS